MKREDLGFIVSRALAVWCATISLRDLAQLYFISGQVFPIRSSDIQGPVNQMAISTVTMTAGYVGLTILLWIKADWFSKLGYRSTNTSELTEDEEIAPEAFQQLCHFRSSILSAVGLFVFLQAGAAGMQSYLYYKSPPAAMVPTFFGPTIEWRGYAAEAALGAVIFIGYTFGDRIREMLTPSN